MMASSSSVMWVKTRTVILLSTILTSSDPSKGQDSLTEIANSETLFGYPAIRYQDSIYGGAIWDMVSYNGHLYATICTGTPENAPDDNSMQSFAMVRGDKNADGSYSWTPIVGDQKTDGAKYCFGIDPARTRSGAANLIVYNDYLISVIYGCRCPRAHPVQQIQHRRGRQEQHGWR